MGTTGIVLIVAGVLAFILILWFIGAFNGLVRSRNEVKNAWSQIDVQLKRRYDLIPNLVNTVKGYAAHENKTFENIAAARSACMKASASGDIGELGKQEGFLTQALKSLFAVAEAYPELKANQNFLALQEELTSTENKIGFSRQFYNDTVLKMNNLVEQIPSNIVAALGGFKKEVFFEIANAAEKEAPKVSF
ncbi:MAG: LemA family protein [Planctomycetes bacterium]|nr:LemA family protein [Planctomycetota bacterium]